MKAVGIFLELGIATGNLVFRKQQAGVQDVALLLSRAELQGAHFQQRFPGF